VNFQGNINYKHIGWAQFSAYLLLFFFYLSSFLFFNFPASKSSNLVFCPLMKIWVQRGNSASKPENKLLKDICATEEAKQNFFDESLQKIFFTKFARDLSLNEELFFDYLKKGNNAFAAISRPQDAPESPIVKSAENEKSLAGHRKDFSEKSIQSFVLSQLARPPNAFQSLSFDLESIRKLDKISRQTQPRAPPALT
jgi:hypothetical protein